MKPASFAYHAPSTVDEALALLQANGPDSRVLAGGQSLIPMMNFRLAAPPVIIDLNRIPDLAYIRDQGDAVRIGAMTRQRAIEFSPIVADKLPLLRAAIKLVGHLPTRSRGTIGGSIAHADPAAELPMVLQALDGEVVVRGPKGERSIAASELFQDAMTTSLAPDEILVEVRLPRDAGRRRLRHRGVRPPPRRFRDCRDRRGDRARRRRLRQGAHRHRRHIVPFRSGCARPSRSSSSTGLGDSAIARAAEAAAAMVEPLSDRQRVGGVSAAADAGPDRTRGARARRRHEADRRA